MRHLILGAGYLGRRLVDYISANEPAATVYKTSRSNSAEIHFDLGLRETWKNLPQVDVTYWTFAAEPFELVKEFIGKHKSQLGRLVVVGTTGVLNPESEHGWVDESTPRSSTLSRTQGEDYLLTAGATLVLSAGIYGPNRSPLDWMRRGLVGPTEKYVNFIHIDDLAAIVFAAANRGEPSKVYIAADGRPNQWKDIFSKLGISPSENDGKPGQGRGRLSKRVNSTHTLQALEIRLKYEDIFLGLKFLR